jgi:ankyrin repeat protein/L-ascorbate metabolism protein UlaG (beta-lactamase superfamily)
MGLLVVALAVAGSAFCAEIHDAAMKGDLQKVKALLAQDSRLLDAENEPSKKTPLHYAAQGGHRDVVEFLLDKGAQVSRPNIAGETPLHYAIGLDSPDVANLLVSRGADVNARTTAGTTPLRAAALWGRLAVIKSLLDKGADPRETLPNGETLLHVTALIGPAEAIGLFVARGAPVNAVTDVAATPLLVACTGGNIATAKALLEQGADPNLRDASGRQPLVLAVRTGQADFVKRMLDAGAKVAEGTTADKRSALHTAAAMGFGSIVDLLLAKGADRTARDSQGRTPLALASLYGSRRIADALGGRRAGNASSAKTTSKTPLLTSPLKPGESIVWYLGQSGWVVKTANHLLVFDYAPGGISPDEPSLANGAMVPGEIGDFPVTVFVTHDHADHYGPAVFDLQKTVKNITYVTGFKPEGKNGYMPMAPREQKSLAGLEVTTIESTDAGVGFFVRVDGVNIFHGGDHCNAQGEAAGAFKQEIDFLADAGLKADLLFALVRGCGQPVGIRNGVYYAIDRLSAKAVFPMHGRGRESVYADFAREAASAGVRVPFYCAEFGGDHFTIDREQRGAGSGEREARNEERGTRNEERGTRNEERGTRNEEREARSEERDFSLLIASGLVLAANPPSSDLSDVLRRAGEVVVRHAQESAAILADETCQQSAYREATPGWGRRGLLKWGWHRPHGAAALEGGAGAGAPLRLEPAGRSVDGHSGCHRGGWQAAARPEGAPRTHVPGRPELDNEQGQKDHRGECQVQHRAGAPDHQRASHPAARALSSQPASLHLQQDRRRQGGPRGCVEGRVPGNPPADSHPRRRQRLGHAIGRHVLDRPGHRRGGARRAAVRRVLGDPIDGDLSAAPDVRPAAGCRDGREGDRRRRRVG